MPHRFFFSYARFSHDTSKTPGGNYLDEFYDDLRNHVAELTGEDPAQVAYRDLDRLRISDNWQPKLIKGLQDSQVLVCVLSPHYLKSHECGREVAFFQERLNKLKATNGDARHRIVPVYWIDQVQCYQGMLPHVSQFFSSLQSTEPGLPKGYPRMGVAHFYGTKETTCCYQFRECLAKRIYELSKLSPGLPELADGTDFDGLPSFFEQGYAKGERVAVGPFGTNVVFAVATRRQSIDPDSPISKYGETAEEWRPFLDKPQRTVGLLTRNALIDAGQNVSNYCPIELSEKLLSRISEAQEVNSPVLIVLDRDSLRVQTIRDSLVEYDSCDATHVGLVTAGGAESGEELLKEVFQRKCAKHVREHHLWTVPPSSTAYERSIVDVVSALRCELQRLSKVSVTLPPTAMPSLSQPGA